MSKILRHPNANFRTVLAGGMLILLSHLTAAAQQPKTPLVISLKGDWRFAVDSGEQGVEGKWYADNFDDGSWKTLVTGKSWLQQGIEHNGWGWFRRQITIPKEYEGIPLLLEMGDNESDDDVWFDGVPIGGLHGKYKYKNINRRLYAVPAGAIRYGAVNTIVTRIWGGNLGFIGQKSQGLVGGNFAATLDPYYITMRKAGSLEQPAQIFDLSNAQHGMPFEILFRFPGDAISGPATLQCELKDFSGGTIASLPAPVEKGKDGVGIAAVKIDPAVAQTIYLRGRFKANLSVQDGSGHPIYTGIKELDHLSFAERDTQPLPPLAPVAEDTPYGKLKLVDEIDASLPLEKEPHPYLESGFTHAEDYMTPGSPVNIMIHDILGKKARESENGWFAYRIGRGKLKIHSTYLLRVEYAEDKPRYCPIEIQAGRNYLDIGWQNGVGPNDPYDPWPISHSWQWYDAMVPLDNDTTGTTGTYAAPGEDGFWVYFLNKVTPGKYYTMYDGGPAIARVKLYEIDPDKNAPSLTLPKDLPQRVLMFDWERQPETDPGDQARFAKLMGYSALSPVMLKWSFSNWTDPLNGYTTTGEDAREYWVDSDYKPGTNAEPAVPGKESQHVKFLAATQRYGINYIPRFEYGGSMDLPIEAHAIGKDGRPAKPDRYGTWGADLLHPATWDDLEKWMDHMIKPYAKDNPQLTGALWRIRCDRMQISYSKFDLDLFAKETGTLISGSDAEQRAWASEGTGREQYDTWWLKKRALFDGKLATLLRSYRADLMLYYYNWEGDKFGMVLPSITTWAFNKQIAFSKAGANFNNDGGGKGRAAYEKDREERKRITGEDYIKVMQTGNFGAAAGGVDRADYAMRPELYRDIKGVELFAPANFLCYADKPDYLSYFKTAEGLAVSNSVSYDEIGARTINPRYEGSMVSPAGPAFSMALELMDYFYGDARTLTYTTYTYGRGFADAHRRFAQAFRALPAISGTVIEQGDPDLKVRAYPSKNGTYVGAAYKGYANKRLSIRIPIKGGTKLTNLVTNEIVPARFTGNGVEFEVVSGPVELNAFLVQ